ncbi:MAG TPA: hypothetical protein EYP53_03720 [Candidatus Latescibacteria bacterium]|nr:hypothetical protein [Candidatus Latescibacterota bacterium]
MSYLISIDAGTTALKVVLFDQHGQIKAQRGIEYNLITPTTDTAELEAEVYWEACRQGIRSVLKQSHIPPEEVAALSISSQGETLIPVDRSGRPLRRAIVWLDNRSGEEARIIEEAFGVEEIYRITGQPEVVPTWPATKVLWIKRNEPGIFRQTHKFLLVEDYILYKLTGQYVTEGSLASSSLFFDINRGTWWGEMVDFVGITPEQLPAVKKTGEVVAPVAQPACRLTGLCEKTMVTTGAMDQAAGMIGAGNIGPGIVTETTGAALAICATTDRVVLDPKRRLPCQYHPVSGLYYLMPWCPVGGMFLRWFRDVFCQLEMEQARCKGLDVYNLLTQQAESVPPGSEGLVALPHLMGAASPEFNPNAKGVFFGITLKHQKGHFVRAVMEAVAFMLRRNLELLEELGIQVQEIRSLGGGSKSLLWNRIKADVTGKPIVTIGTSEAASLGVAILAGVGVGIFPSLHEAVSRMVKVTEGIEPNLKDGERYREAYRCYLKLYEQLGPMF